MREIDKWPKRFKYKRISKLVIVICFFLSIAVAALTYYGSNVGNFLITIEEDAIKNMSLDETSEFTNERSLLTAEGLREMTHATLSNIPEDIDKIDGSHNDNEKLKYFAYTFYAKNISEVAVEYSVEIVILKIYKKTDSAVRIMVIRNDEDPIIYAKPQEQGQEIGQPEKNYNDENPPVSLYEVTNFENASRIYKEQDLKLEPEQYDKYTVVIWLEGWDPECIDSIKGGTIKMEMRFATQ